MNIMNTWGLIYGTDEGAYKNQQRQQRVTERNKNVAPARYVNRNLLFFCLHFVTAIDHCVNVSFFYNELIE